MQLRRRTPRLRDAEHERLRCCFEIKRVRPELAVILLSGSEVPKYALALVDAFVLKLEASRALLSTIAELCSGIRYPKQKQEGFRR